MERVFVNELEVGDVVDWLGNPAKITQVFPPMPSATEPGHTVVWFDVKTHYGRTFHVCGVSFKDQIYRTKSGASKEPE